MNVCHFEFLFVVTIFINLRPGDSYEEAAFSGEKREKRIASLNQISRSNEATHSKNLGRPPAKPGFHKVNDPEKPAFERVVNNKIEAEKSRVEEVMTHLAELRETVFQEAKNKIKTSQVKNKSPRPDFNSIEKHEKFAAASAIEKLEKPFKLQIGKFDEHVPSMSGTNKSKKLGKIASEPGFRKIERSAKPEVEKYKSLEKIRQPSETCKIKKFEKLPPKLEFSEIDELTIKKLEKSVAPDKALSNKAALSNPELRKKTLKRGTDEAEENRVEKFLKRLQTETLGAPKLPLDGPPLKRGAAESENKQIVKPVADEKVSARFIRDQEYPQLKQDNKEADFNKVEKMSPKSGILYMAKTPTPMRSVGGRFENNMSEASTEGSRIEIFGPTKVPRDRKIAAPNLVFNLDSENIAFPSERTRAQYLQRGQFVPKNVMINRVQFYGDKAYVTMPKLKRGVPFSVGKVSLAQGPKRDGLKIEAFPSWAIHRHANISGIVNAVDMFVDEQATLWILDSGVVWTLESPERIAPPKVFAVDLRKEQVTRAINLSSFIDKTSRLQHIAVEAGDHGCQFVYISDASNRGLIIWDVCNDFGSKIILPKSVQPEIKGGSVPDILYLNLISRNKTSLLAVTFYSSDYLFAMPTYSLQNLKYGTVTGDVAGLGRKPGRIVMLGSDQKWVYFRYSETGDVYAWDASTDFRKENCRKLYTGNGLEYATQVAVGYRKFVWALESNFQDFNQGNDDSGLIFSIRAICRRSDLT